MRLTDWKAVLLRVWDNLGYHNVYLVAAGIGFFGMLALFPAIGALVGIYGLISDPQVIMDQIRPLSRFLPQDAYTLIVDQVTQLLSADSQALSVASLIATGIALWSARTGVGAMIDGVNITYSERNERGFLAWYAISFLMTVVFVLVVLCAIVAIVIVPAALQTMRLGTQAEWVASMIRWPVVIAAVMLGLGILYRYGPQRSQARLPWITWGSVAATGLWLIGSLAFSWYVSKFTDYNATYGSLGAIVGLMLWFYVGSYAILLGAELNAEMEHQTARDTTTGPEKPLGERGAYVADHVPGRSPARDEAYRGVENVGDAPDDPEAAAEPKDEPGRRG
ncbi:MAG TPA: YihY/virulence factor BrkB family protein [Paracoccaceae bacterium]|nr:YihY/virulence factor BrkB family protein [Paracoccaceae bacterium]